MAYDTKTVALTGQRVGELERVKDLLSGMDIDYGGSNQQALSGGDASLYRLRRARRRCWL